MGFFTDLIYQKNDWEEIKKTQNVYPVNLVSEVEFEAEDGSDGSGWVDKAYLSYSFKKYCRYNVFISVDLTDEVAKNNPNLDLATIENYFLDELRKFGITHIVARLVTKVGVSIELYVENAEESYDWLKKTLADPTRFISFNCQIHDDPKWKGVRHVLDL